jgi:polyadenylate-binding protein 2
MAQVTSTDPAIAETVIGDNEEDESKEILLMKQRVEEMEREAKKLRELQAAAESSTTGDQQEGEDGVPMETEDEKALIDSRSVFVGNVDYAATAEDIQAHFQACGTINRITILCDKFTGHPKGFAYVEFAEPEFIDPALALDNSLFHGRLIKVMAKRTNVPGFNRGRGRGRGAYRGGYRGGFRGGGGGYSPYRGFRGRYVPASGDTSIS